MPKRNPNSADRAKARLRIRAAILDAKERKEEAAMKEKMLRQQLKGTR